LVVLDSIKVLWLQIANGLNMLFEPPQDQRDEDLLWSNILMENGFANCMIAGLEVVAAMFEMMTEFFMKVHDSLPSGLR
jgi:hypothetical protein